MSSLPALRRDQDGWGWNWARAMPLPSRSSKSNTFMVRLFHVMGAFCNEGEVYCASVLSLELTFMMRFCP